MARRPFVPAKQMKRRRSFGRFGSPMLVALSLFYPLAHLGLARAFALFRDVGSSRKSCQDFWSRTDIPVCHSSLGRRDGQECLSYLLRIDPFIS